MSNPNQSTNLPPKEEIITTIHPVMVLTGRDNFEEWSYVVHSRLDLHGFADLISDLPRPQPNDPSYRLWQTASKAVQNWLITIINPAILRSLRVHATSTRYADECWTAISHIVNGQGITQTRRIWLRTVQMQRSEFGSMELYIDNLRSNLAVCHRLEMSITWYQAALLLLSQTHDELPNWTTVCELNLNHRNPKEYTQEDFFRLCTDATERSYLLGHQYSAPPSGTKTGDQTGTKPGSRKNTPPKDKDAAQWASEQRQKTPAKYGRNCAYCGIPGHPRTTCFYLCPELRTSQWKPRSDLWCYYPKPQKVALPSVSEEEDKDPFDFMAMVFPKDNQIIPKKNAISKQWIADTGSGAHLCADINDFIEYHPYSSHDTPYTYEAANGSLGHSEGYGKVQLHLILDNGHIKPLTLDARYDPTCRYSLFGCIKAKRDHGLYFNGRRNILEDKNGIPCALLHDSHNVSFFGHGQRQYPHVFSTTLYYRQCGPGAIASAPGPLWYRPFIKYD